MAEQGQREKWTTRLGFILAAAGSAVGLGNIWRFPFVVGQSGGAAFVVIYLIIVALIGYPMMVTETSIGRAAKKNPIGAFAKLAPSTKWWLVGALGVLTGFVILSYYSVVAGWSVAYIFRTLTGALTAGTDFEVAFGDFVGRTWTPIIWHLVFMALTVGVIAGGVVKGIQRWVKILWPVMGVLLLIVIIRSVTLPGAGEGVAFFLAPDFTQLTGEAFLNAIAQAFFTLSLGMGMFITYGSYLSDNDNVPGTATRVIGLDTGVAILAGLMIFPAVFAMGLEPAAGPGLTFMTLPAVFAEMPAGVFFGTVFFILLSVAALTSAISLLEVVTAWLIDEKGWARKKAAVFLGVVIFLVGIPASLGYGVLSGVQLPVLETDLLDTYDWIANSLFLPLGGLFTAIFAGWVWGHRNAAAEANKSGVGLAVGTVYGFLIRFIVPIAVVAAMIFTIWGHFAG